MFNQGYAERRHCQSNGPAQLLEAYWRLLRRVNLPRLFQIEYHTMRLCLEFLACHDADQAEASTL